MKHVLTIEESAPRLVQVFGKTYRLRERNELSLAQDARLRRTARELGTLLDAAETRDLSSEEEQQLERVSREACALALDAPADVVARLTDYQRYQIADAGFFGKPPAPTPTPEATRTPKRPPRGRTTRSRR